MSPVTYEYCAQCPIVQEYAAARRALNCAYESAGMADTAYDMPMVIVQAEQAGCTQPKEVIDCTIYHFSRLRMLLGKSLVSLTTTKICTK